MSEENNSSYYGIMPAPVRYNNNLSSSEKIMYCEITALSNKYGYCKAGNQYFANLYDVTKPTVSGWFSSLKDEGLIRIQYIRDGKQIKERRAYPLMDKLGGYLEKDEGGIKKKDNTPIKENLKDNTTSSNNTSNNTNNNVDYKFWVDKWNEINDAQCRVTDKKRKHIRQRLKTWDKDELIKAMENRASDSWINGDGLQYKTKFSSLWCNDEKIEHWLQRDKSKQKQQGSLYNAL